MIANRKYNYSLSLITAFILLLAFSCTREFDELEPASFPTNGDVFIDGFSLGLEYAAFGGSKVTAFNVVTDDTYSGAEAMRFDIPDADDPGGGFAAGIFLTPVGRDLSGYDALTFWAKASESVDISELGFGFTFDQEDFRTSIKGVPLTTSWTKYFIPIADASKLTEENGLFYYIDNPDNEKGYTFWVDEVKFENLGTLARPQPAILAKQDQSVTAETGDKVTIGGLSMSFNLPTGIDQSMDIAPAYFTFSSSNPSVATVSETGEVTVLDEGESVITAKLGELEALGSLTITSTGAALLPPEAAPTPTIGQDSVISMFSNVYNDVTVDTWNPFWEFSTTLLTDVQIGDDDVKSYKQLNFVGILTESEQIDASEMTHFHLDIWTPDATAAPAAFKVLLRDYGTDGNFDGGDDSFHELSFTSPTLATASWVSLDIPLTDFAGLVNRSNLAQLVLSGDLPNVFVDNVYFYNAGEGGMAAAPTEGAPAPTAAAADVISLFSDAYTNVEGTDFNPDWGQATVVSQVDIAGNNTMLYSALNYQGIQLASGLDISEMEFLHIDYWTDNSTALNTFLISSGPVETAYAMTVPTSGWVSLDIPLADFSPVDLADIVQLKFDGNGNIYWDNLYFYKGGSGATEPTEPAPAPSADAANVISVFSDAYTNVAGSDLNPNWGQATVVSEVSIAGNNTLLYSGLNFQGLQLGSAQDVSGMEFLHIDFWTANSTAFNTFLISSGPVETAYAMTVPTSGWASVDIPLADFSPVDLADIVQFKFEGNGDIYLDNVYFYTGGSGATEPTAPAPAPTAAAANVISVFSDAYMNVAGSDLNPNWGQGTVVSEVSIAGNNTMLYSGLNFQGLQLGSAQDVSGMEFLHIDFWTANSTALNTFLISSGPVETAYAMTVPTSGWTSVDIPLADFSPVDLADIVQFKFEGNGDIYLDNIYFYTGGGGPLTDPNEAAPTPTLAAEDVISLFSDAYTDVAVDTWRTDWSAAVLEDVSVVGNATKKYSALDVVGIETAVNTVDATDMTHFHIDVWSADLTFFGIKLVDFGADGAFGGGDDTEQQLNFEAPTQGGWVSYDIPLSDFTGLTSKGNMAQYILVGQPTGTTTIYVDNVYFHK